jgi:hypothetical protein
MHLKGVGGDLHIGKAIGGAIGHGFVTDVTAGDPNWAMSPPEVGLG